MRTRDQQQMRDIVQYVENYAMEHDGNSPSTTMIARKFGLCRSGAYNMLVGMDELGMIIYQDGKIRTEKLDKINRKKGFAANYPEGITAGTPQEIEGAVDEYYMMPTCFVGREKGPFFTVEVSGDSMIDAGIDPGDLVIFRQSEEARNGDIVSAYIRGQGSTMKRLCRDDEGPFLWAENRQWDKEERFFGREFDIQGVAIKILKDISA